MADAGMMRSFDQYGNVMLEDTFERHVVGNVYADERVRAPPGSQNCPCDPVCRADGTVCGEAIFFCAVLLLLMRLAQVGLYVIRGENLVLLGELDMNKEAQGTALREVPLEQIMAQKAAQKQEKVPTPGSLSPH
jgi:small nuclear ribonucleoprotein (snRNP)-like protein